ncbi:site-specific DNA-methyltransferase [Spirosoma sp. KUDC1026]|uniref:site-specific DNA-methyltransferase n=1 Tax=Spirosoma sp. KUDC1026 TaxID=2745947 RepID=UPI00159BC0B3|nr:site-specific DNA-methyltransferase [Spirosoma sp. KUDC1026]QKZ12665.1 site-specific DNA-methyltransferase [Spirosoma sp. KUDC1026]
MALAAKDQFKELLRELFQLNHTDLDFGIYRILNLKAAEVTQFLDVELDAVVESVRNKIAGREATDATTTLNEAQQQLATQFGINFDLPDDLETKANQYGQLPIFQEPYQKFLQAKQQLANVQVSADTERDIYNRLYQFFERYYEEGDFITKPRAGRDSYLIPYNGEEVKLYWANYDQYYIKTGESFRNYVFTNTATDPAHQRTVEFRLRDAESSLNNNKEEKGRLFIPVGLPDADTWFTFSNNRLTIWFEYRLPTPEDIAAWEIKPAQRTADKGVVVKLLTLLPDRIGQTADVELITLFQTNRKRGKDSVSTFQYHLERFMAVNKFDYFIHKDLRGFLRRELDFFLKNEVLAVNFLDPRWTDADVQTSISLNVTLASTIRQLALTIIEFLGELEEFQKRLFEKRKFVVQADYCLTLDRIPDPVRDAVLSHVLTDPDQKQQADWQTLGFIDKDTVLNQDYLLANDKLVLDTAYLPDALKWKLLAALDNLDAQTNGLLLNSENWQALNFLKPKYRNQVKCIYIDPPYNTGENDFPYKDSFQHSSWLSMMHDRLVAARDSLTPDGVLFVSLNDKKEEFKESHRLYLLLDAVFGEKNYVEVIIWTKNTTHNDSKTYSRNHEYVFCYAKNRALVEQIPNMFRQQKPGFDEVVELINRLNSDYPSVETIRQELKNLYKTHVQELKDAAETAGIDWEDAKGEDDWKAIYNYKYAEYRLIDDEYVSEIEAESKKAVIRPFTSTDASWPNSSSLTADHRNPHSPEYRFYKPLHPKTNQPCACPQRGWLWRQNKIPGNDAQSFESMLDKHMILFGNDETTVPRIKKFLHKTETDVAKSVLPDNTDGAKQLADLFGERGLFANPKPTTLIRRFVEQTTFEGETVMDFFAGSGTTADAVLSLQHVDNKSRPYVLVEMGDYFDKTLIRRVKKVIYSDTWRNGKPIGVGSSHLFQYMRLEQYEDTLNNIEFSDAAVQEGSELSFLDKIRYSLDYGTRTSGSLLNPDKFMRPFSYTLRVVRQNEIRDDQPIDLITTFNYLLGLRVVRYHVAEHQSREYRVVVGQKGLQPYLIIWRDVIEGKPEEGATDFTAERDWVLSQPWYDTTALIYANADNGFGAQAIETEFVRLLWDSAV